MSDTDVQREIDIRTDTHKGTSSMTERELSIRILIELRILNSKIERLIEQSQEC